MNLLSLRDPNRRFLVISIAALLLLLGMARSYGQATWLAMPPGNDWNSAANWTPANVPDNRSESASFGASSVTDISLSGDIDIDQISFGAGASSYTIHTAGHRLYLYVAGIVNNSGALQTFDVNSGPLVFNAGTAANATFKTSVDGSVNFDNSSTAGHADISVQSTNHGGLFFRDNSTAANSTILNQGFTQFGESSSAGSATITNEGEMSFFGTSTAENANITSRNGGRLDFLENSTAAQAHITGEGSTSSLTFRDQANAGTATILMGGATQFAEMSSAGSAMIESSGDITFFDHSTAASSGILNHLDVRFQGFSTAGSATIVNDVSAVLDFSENSTAGDATITTRNGARTSFVDLSSGGNARFITELGGGVFFDNLSATATTTGSIAGAGTYSLGNTDLTTGGNNDSTEVSGSITGNGGLTKVGTGKLTLSGVNSYAGGTTVAKGALAITSDAALGALSGGVTLRGGGLVQLLASFDSARPVNIPDEGAIDTGSFNSTFSGQISGAGQLIKFGSGTLTLTNTNVQKFGTLIAAGAVQISTDSNLGDTAAPLSFDGGTLRLLANVTTSRNGSVTFGGAVIDTNGFDLIHNGNLVGVTGGLTKIGAGTLTLNGMHQYTGVTSVLGGTLLLNGSVAGDVEVGGSPQQFARGAAVAAPAAPIFGGTGMIGGSLRNFSGIVSPGNSPGTLHIGGDFTQGTQGTLLIEIAGRKDGEFDRLQVGGHALLDGEVRFVTLNNFRPARGGDRFVFLTANAGIAGAFASVALDAPLLAGHVEYTRTTAVLSIARRPILSLLNSDSGLVLADAPSPEPLTPNQTAVAKSLDRAIDDRRLIRVFDQLDRFSIRELPRGLDLIAPDELGAIYEIGIGTANVQAFNLDRHLSDLRAGARGFSAGRLSLSGVAEGPGDGANSGDGKDDAKKDIFTPGTDNRWSTFVSGSGEFTDVHGDGNSPDGYDITTGGFTVGATYRVSDGFGVGAFVGYAGTGAELTGDGHILVNSGKLGLYATLYNEAWYLNGMVAGGYNSYDIKRQSIGGTTRGETDGGEFSALLSGGYDFHVRAFTLGPIVETGYTRVAYSGYRERASAAPLAIEGNGSDSLRSRLGARLAWQSGGPGSRWHVRPELRVAWQHEWGDQTRPTDASFAAGGGPSFRVEGPKEGRDAFVVNASVSFSCGERFSTYLAYDGTLARERYDSHTVSAGVRWSF